MEIKFLKIPTGEKTRKYRCNYKMITWELEPTVNEKGHFEWRVSDSFGISQPGIVFKSRNEAKEYLIRETEKFYKA